jgi:hypothetical protein
MYRKNLPNLNYRLILKNHSVQKFQKSHPLRMNRKYLTILMFRLFLMYRKYPRNLTFLNCPTFQMNLTFLVLQVVPRPQKSLTYHSHRKYR